MLASSSYEQFRCTPEKNHWTEGQKKERSLHLSKGTKPHLPFCVSGSRLGSSAQSDCSVVVDGADCGIEEASKKDLGLPGGLFNLNHLFS